MSMLQYQTQSAEEEEEDEDEDIQNSKRSFFISLTITIAYSLLKFIMIVIVMVFVIFVRLKDFKQTNSYLRTQQNLWLWEQDIIIDFKTSKGYNCPQGYDQLTNYAWPGNFVGCSCKINIGVYDYEVVLEGQCSQIQLFKGCNSVYPNQEILIRFWVYGINICLKRLHNYNFYSSEQNIINPNGLSRKQCSLFQDYQIDLVQTIPCPVTRISKNNLLNISITETNFTYESGDNYPIVAFRISQFDFCQSFTDNNKSPGRKSNYILQKKAQIQCQSLDIRTVEFDSQGQADLFNNNNRIIKVIQTLPAYPRLTNDYHYKLGFLRYPAWTYSCRMSSTKNLLIAKDYLTLGTVQQKISTLSIITTISLIIALFLLIVHLGSLYFYLKVKYNHGMLFLKDYQIKKTFKFTNIVRDRQNQLLKFLANLICPIVSIILLVSIYTKLLQSKQWFSSIYQCTQANFIIYLQSYQVMLGEKMILAMTSIFINIGLIATDIAYILWRFYKGDLQEEEEKQQEEEIVEISDKELGSIMNESITKQINFTQQALITNDFHLSNKMRTEIFRLQDQDEQIDQSQYSQSSKDSD